MQPSSLPTHSRTHLPRISFGFLRAGLPFSLFLVIPPTSNRLLLYVTSSTNGRAELLPISPGIKNVFNIVQPHFELVATLCYRCAISIVSFRRVNVRPSVRSALQGPGDWRDAHSLVRLQEILPSSRSSFFLLSVLFCFVPVIVLPSLPRESATRH